jgi:hypothetical protein
MLLVLGRRKWRVQALLLLLPMQVMGRRWQGWQQQRVLRQQQRVMQQQQQMQMRWY